MNIFNDIKNDNFLMRGFFINLFVIFISLLYILVNYGNLPPFIPLFNQLPWGEDRIAETVWIFVIPGLSLLVFLFNLIYSSFTYKNTPLIPRILVITSFMVSVLALLFIVRTVQIAF